ncbi:ATP-binding cassette domain-containing protein [Auraticoccus sp. F435]|uniref:ATP-binding cassette domain-containing protein n=1 Tax=Auraticoccus cholistanensis TaxID=2656650 RepID=A0A6A9V108_9ACTN|nr:ATP-binding cassette domain-containing protein [Auraticoccus cholistanensis]MVA76589.1 ATP-binding cassette domain-containing protein [Auraticoccus cholistanensis]
MSEPAVEIRDLRKSYGRQSVLDGVELTVPTGALVALLGPNGAGKTTLVGIATTLVRPDAGSVRVAGFDVVRQAEQVRRRISVTGQYAAVDEVLTGVENLRLMGRLSGLGARDARARAQELLAAFDLEDAAGRRVGTYSGGMRRRLDLAVSVLVPPAVLFLDEPTTGLDTRSRLALWQVIGRLAAEGTTILLTTQYLEEADQLADRVTVLDHGRVVAEGSPAELKSRVGGEVVELRDDLDRVLREVPTDGTLAGLRRVVDGLDEAAGPGTRVGLRRPSLDDVFLQLTGRPAGAAAPAREEVLR